ncbi:MAG: hypothetical protein N2516_02925 [Dictyoglomaceae bacterium]|nr:hypothetical protein [Dictyoglomaceae bacterium]
MFIEIIKMALHSFSTNKLRTFLTTLISLGEGTRVSIERQFTT